MIRFVDGLAGNDAYNGLANVWDGVNGPKKTLTASLLLDAPSDLVHVRSGVYRETATVSVSGTAGNPVEYRGDYAGLIWPGGGVVRITGSDNDQTATRANCIAATSKNYRTFRSFALDGCSSHLIAITTGATNWTVSQCHAYVVNAPAVAAFNFIGTVTNNVFENCDFLSGAQATTAWIKLATSASSFTGNIIRNCIGQNGYVGFQIYTSGVLIQNCLIMGCQIGVYADTPAAETITINNCQILNSTTGLQAQAAGDLTENFNNIYGCGTQRINVSAGANSVSYPPLFDTRWFHELVNGGNMVTPFDLSAWSQLINLAGVSPTTTDMRGTGAIGGVREIGSLEYDPTLQIAGGAGGAVRILPNLGRVG